MSTARNHAKRSHRSESMHCKAETNRLFSATRKQNETAGGRLGYLSRMMKRNKEGEK